MSRLVTIAITSVILAFWEIYLKGAYIHILEERGGNYGFAEATVGYFVVLGSAVILGWWFGRKRGD